MTTRQGILPLIKFPDDLTPQPGCEIADEFTDQPYNFEYCPKSADGKHTFHLGWCLECDSEEPE